MASLALLSWATQTWSFNATETISAFNTSKHVDTPMLASTTTTVTADPQTITYGQTVIFTATVAGGISPQGTVTFKNSNVTLCTSALLTNFTAQCSTSALPVGSSVSITATYSGDTNNETSTSTTYPETVNPAIVTASLISTVSKTYDGTSSATLDTTNYQLTGVINSEIVILNDPTTGTYNGANAGSNKNIFVSGLSISGQDASNYTLASTSINANIGTITQKTVTANLISPVSRTYDGTNAATLVPTNYQLTGVINNDSVNLNDPTNGNYDNKNVGFNKDITVSGLSISGQNADNYILASTSINAYIGTILKSSLSITANDLSKIVGTTYTFTGTEFTETGLFPGDSITNVTLTSAGASSGATVAGSPYAIIPSNAQGTGLSNYNFSYIYGYFTVTPQTVPGAPTNVTAVASSSQVMVAWAAPLDTGGLSITGYTVTASPGGATCTTTGAITCPVTSLAHNTLYTFTVTAMNDLGTGPASIASSAVMLEALPPNGRLFNIESSGTPAQAQVTLCLNGKGPLTCEMLPVSGLELNINSTVPNHTYPFAGIKINTPGYVLANPGIDCIPLANGFCLFVVSNTQSKTIALRNIAAAPSTNDGSAVLTGSISGENKEETNSLNDASNTENAPTSDALASNKKHTISGKLSGMNKNEKLILTNNGEDNLIVDANGTFTFKIPVNTGKPYDVTLYAQPTGQTCHICANRGTVLNTDITSIFVNCSSTGDTMLCVNPTDLTLSVRDPELNPALTGKVRKIKITNIGTTTAINVAHTASPLLPTGSKIMPITCGNIEPLQTCELSIIPGPIPSAAPYDVSPTPISLTIVGNNTNTLTPTINILTYGSVYESGFVFSIDDTTPSTDSVAGKIAALSDQDAASLEGISWIPNQMEDNVPPTALSHDPATVSLASSPTIVACNVATDGACNTDHIVFYYSKLIKNLTSHPQTQVAQQEGAQVKALGTTQEVPRYALDYGHELGKQLLQTNETLNSSYAAQHCKLKMEGLGSWYLPSICEMGPDLDHQTCNTDMTEQNMLNNLPLLLSNFCTGPSCLSGHYWSSSEYLNNVTDSAWVQFFAPDGASSQSYAHKMSRLRVRCTSAFGGLSKKGEN